MPVEPPPTRWSLPRAGAPLLGEIAGVGADLEPGTLLEAYRTGLFPMRLDGVHGPLAWWSPGPRGILPLDALIVSRSLRRSLRRYTVTVDTAFADVVAGCADPRREGAWIDEEIGQAYQRLHQLGWAHSVEAWDGSDLVGGLYGVAVGGLFAGESMFHRATDASKVALVELCARLLEAGGRLVDVQEETPHLVSLGQVLVRRADYVGVLTALRDRPVHLATDRRPVARLAARPSAASR